MNIRDLIGRPRRERPSIRRIRQIAEHVGARSYLEIGVNQGLTFNGLVFERKVAVDPNFRFAPDDFQNDGVAFHEVTSDVYFTQLNRGERFDIIFLDGLHTFQQTFRDFCNSLSCGHEKTIWLVDDVLPVDVYSAWPDQKEAVEFRRQAGGDSPAWHGDVYKTMFALHDFFPMFRYVTLGSADNSQAIVWRAPRPDFAPVFNSLEAIERLGYFDFVKHRQMLNVMSEDDGLKAFMGAVAPAGSS